jgi:hypothetical protein
MSQLCEDGLRSRPRQLAQLQSINRKQQRTHLSALLFVILPDERQRLLLGERQVDLVQHLPDLAAVGEIPDTYVKIVIKIGDGIAS